MDKMELLSIISELIANNSNMEADSDDEPMLNGVEDVMLNITATDGDVTILFTSGEKNVITVR